MPIRRAAAVLAAAHLAALLAAGSARGQLVEDYRFRGKVIDQHGKPIPKVQVSFHNLQTGARIEFTTEEDGTFDRRMIPHGIYEATFQKDGFVSHRESLDWSAAAPQTIEKVAQIVLENQADRARKELGKKAAKLYEDAYAALRLSDCVTARKNAEALLALGAGSFEYAVRFVLARCHAMKDEVEAAVAEYEKVLALKPGLFEAHFDLALLLEKQGNHTEALQEYAKAAELRPADAETQYNMGAILFKKGDYEAAKPHLEKAIELNPAHSQAIKALGFADLQGEKKDVAAGVQLLKKYLELEPKAKDAAQIQEIVKAFEAAAAHE